MILELKSKQPYLINIKQLKNAFGKWYKKLLGKKQLINRKLKFILSKTFLYLAFFGTQKTKIAVGFFSHSYKFYDALFFESYNEFISPIGV